MHQILKSAIMMAHEEMESVEKARYYAPRETLRARPDAPARLGMKQAKQLVWTGADGQPKWHVTVGRDDAGQVKFAWGQARLHRSATVPIDLPPPPRRSAMTSLGVRPPPPKRKSALSTLGAKLPDKRKPTPAPQSPVRETLRAEAYGLKPTQSPRRR
jgi:hypothetical protein